MTMADDHGTSEEDFSTNSMERDTKFKRPLFVGFWVVGLTVGTFVLWSLTWPLASGSYIEGKLALNAKPIDLNHSDGGRVTDLLVSIGDYVQAGQIILKFETSELESQLEITEARLNRFIAERIRRNREADGFETMPDNKPDKIPFDVWQQETTRFFEQLASIKQQLRIQESRIKQIQDSVSGSREQMMGIEKIETSIRSELARLRPLLEDNLISEDRGISLERQLTGLAKERSGHQSTIATQMERIEEINLAVTRLKQDYRQQAIEQIAKLDARIDELGTQKRSLKRRIQAAELVAPLDGWIDDLSLTIEGKTIRPGATIAQFVPDSGSFMVTGQLSPVDIDSVEVGQKTTLEFKTFSTRNPPRVQGTLAQISAGALDDPRTRQSFYRVKITIDENQPIFDEIRDDLRVGMPVQALIQSGERTFGEYIASPFVEMTRGAFHE